MRELDPHGRARLLVVLYEIDGTFILRLERPAIWRRAFCILRSTRSFQAVGGRTSPAACFVGPWPFIGLAVWPRRVGRSRSHADAGVRRR